MNDAAVNVDDTVDVEPMHEWDRDNPDMSVGTCYPSMTEFRLAVRQHAIIKEFEYDTEHSDKERFRANCAALAAHGFLELEPNMMAVLGYNLFLLLNNIFFYVC